MMQEKICTVTTIKASIEDTIDFVNYHLNISIDHMFLFFDDPDDIAIDELSAYKEVTCIRCNSQYWSDVKSKSDISLPERQKINAKFALKSAKESGYNWIIHIDSDELIYSEGNFKALLSKVPQDIHFIRLPPLEAVPEKKKYERVFAEINLFKILPTRKQKCLAYILGCRGAFFKGEFLRGHLVGKSATRINADIASVDVHRPLAIDNKKLRSSILPNIKLLHFDCRGFKEWEEKWIIKSSGILYERIRKNRKKQLDEFNRVYQDGGRKLEELYGQLNYISLFEKYILTKIGLLKQIHIDRKSFKRDTEISYLEPVVS